MVGCDIAGIREIRMNWDDLRIVIAVSRAGSFARAARMLGIDETTVSRRIRRIERALDVALFDAVDGARVPTAHCTAILAHTPDFERAAEAVEAAVGAAKRAGDTPMRKLRISATASVAEHILAPGLEALFEACPGLSLTLEASNENADMARWQADLAIRLGRPDKGTFIMRKLGDLRFCLVRPAEGCDGDLPVSAYPDTLLNSPEMQALARFAPGGARRLTTAHPGIMRAYLSSGRAIGILPDYLANPLRQDAAIEVVDLDVRREVWLLMQTHLKDDPYLRIVVNWIIARFATMAEGKQRS